MENEINENIFMTRDLYLASTLITLGFIFIGTDCQIEGAKNLPVGYFKFEKTPELTKAKNEYTQGSLKIEPKSFVTNMHSLKAEVNNIYRNPNERWG